MWYYAAGLGLERNGRQGEDFRGFWDFRQLEWARMEADKQVFLRQVVDNRRFFRCTVPCYF